MVMQPESSGLNVAVVEPGSADDPFTRGANPTQQTIQPTVQPTSQPKADDVKPEPKPAPQPKVLTEEEIQARISKAQAGLDRRITQLQSEVEKANAAAEKARSDARDQIREAQKQGLRPDQVEELTRAWAQEDRQAALEVREQAVIDLYRSTEGLRLLTAYGDFGVTEDDILEFTGDPTQLEDYVKGIAFDKLREGGTSAAGAKKAVQAAADANPSPGSDSPQDIGGAGTSPSGAKLLTSVGLGSMAQNVKTLFNDPTGRPW